MVINVLYFPVSQKCSLYFDIDENTPDSTVLFSTVSQVYTLAKTYLDIPETRELSIVNPTVTGPVYFRDGISPTIFLKVEINKLNAPQLVFQLAHELCHFSLFDGIQSVNLKWFEETLCDTATLFFLGKYAELKPYPERHIVENYLSNCLLSDKYEEFPIEQISTMERYDRKKQRYLAIQLLSLFKMFPEFWTQIHHYSEVEASTLEELEKGFESIVGKTFVKEFSMLRVILGLSSL